MSETNFPKFQWSRFTKDHSVQLVVRCDNLEEFHTGIGEATEMIDMYDVALEASKPSQSPPTATTATQGATPATSQYSCKFVLPDGSVCNAPAELKSGVSKAGKSWRGIFCSANQEHVTWVRNRNTRKPTAPANNYSDDLPF